MNYQTNYKTAVNWCNNSFILCNDIQEIDSSIFDNARFAWVDDDDNQKDIYLWYLTDCNADDVEFLEQHFGLLFTYSDTLDLFVLCVDHYGTSWDCVHWVTDLENAARELGE